MSARRPTPMTPNENEIALAVQAGEIAPEEALAAVQQMLAEAMDPDAERKAAEERRMRLSALGRKLHGEAQEQVKLRQNTEERWYQDVRQFNGQPTSTAVGCSCR